MTTEPGPNGNISMTQAELAGAIGVNPASISNWRKRHPDFPSGRTTEAGGRTYDVTAMIAWLEARDRRARTTTPGRTYAERLRDHLDRRPTVAAARDVAELDPGALRALETVRSKYFPSIDRERFVDIVLLLACTWAIDPEVWDDVQAGSASVAAIERRIDPLLRGRGAGFDAQAILEPLRAAPPDGVRRLVAVCGQLGVRGFDQVLVSFAKWLGADSDSYRTPAEVAALMAACASVPRSGPVTVSDPYCRGAELLLAGADRRVVTAVGMNDAAARRAQLCLLIHGVSGTVSGPRRRPPWRQTDSGQRYDVVLTNPPFRQRLDELDRGAWMFGTPPENRADLAWMQVALGQTTESGTAVVLMSAAAAVPGDRRSGLILRAAVDSGALRAVIRLPSSLFPVTSIDTMIWVLGHPDPARKRVVFVDATGLIRKQHQQDRPRLVGVEAIADIVTGRVLVGDRAVQHLAAAGPDATARGAAVAVPIADIAARGYLLTPDSYLGRVDPEAARGGLRTATEERARTQRCVERCPEPAAVVERQGIRAQEVPDNGWHSVRLHNLCDIRSGQSVLHGSVLDAQARTGPIVLRARDIRARRIASESAARLTGMCAHTPSLTVSEGDLLFVRAGQVGEVGLVGSSAAGALFDSNLLRLRPDPSQVDSAFLLEYLLCAATRSQITSIATVNTVPSIGGVRLGELVVDLPPLSEQRAFAAVLAAHENRILAMRAALDAAVELREVVASGLLGGTVIAE